MQIPVKFFMLSLSISLIITGMMIGVWNFTIEGLKDLIDPVTSLLALLATAILLGFMYVQIDSQIKQHKFQRRIESSKILNEYYRRFSNLLYSFIFLTEYLFSYNSYVL